MPAYYECEDKVVFLDYEDTGRRPRGIMSRLFFSYLDGLDPAKLYAVNPDLKKPFMVLLLTEGDTFRTC
jgi:hypothetical protein